MEIPPKSKGGAKKITSVDPSAEGLGKTGKPSMGTGERGRPVRTLAPGGACACCRVFKADLSQPPGDLHVGWVGLAQSFSVGRTETCNPAPLLQDKPQVPLVGFPSPPLSGFHEIQALCLLFL